jgi:6-phosphogluconolactonase
MKRLISLIIALSLLMSMTVMVQAADGAGAVYAMTNGDGGNMVVAYHRAADGTLTLAGTFATGGLGETTEPGDALGGSNPLIMSPDQRWLFAVNAGSNSISVFQVNADDSLTLVDDPPVSSGGEFPVSLTLYKNLLYVLNSGGDGNITGFTLDTNGHLTPLAGSTRSLDLGLSNPPFFLNSAAQVGFTPSGDKLVITVKGAVLMPPDPKILIYNIKPNGLPSKNPVTNDKIPVPFGFVFDDLNNLIVAQPFGDQPPGGMRGAASSYDINGNGKLVKISDHPVENHQTATCWIAITTSTRFAYTTNNGGDGMNPGGTISSYLVASDGSLSLISAIAARTGDAPVDLVITPNNQYLYNVNAFSGTVSMFEIDQTNGNLISLGEIGGLPDDGSGSAVGIAAR